MAGAQVAAGATVSGSVLMTGARVERGARVIDSVVGPGAVVGADAVLEGVTLGDDARVAAGAVPEPGTRVDCGATHPDPLPAEPCVLARRPVCCCAPKCHFLRAEV